MSKETILKIREAEDEAARIVAAAETQAKEMRAAAESAGQELCRNAEKTALAERSERLGQADAEIAEMGAQNRAETVEEIRGIAGKARLNRTSARKIVLRGLYAKCR